MIDILNSSLEENCQTEVGGGGDIGGGNLCYLFKESAGLGVGFLQIVYNFSYLLSVT